MTRFEVRPFGPADLDAAAELLADRHRRHRLAWPALNPAYEEPDGVRGLISAALGRAGASGSIAFADGRAVAYVLGAPRDAKWGANVWVEDAGSAGSDPEAIRIAYAVAAAHWAAAGLTHHYSVVPATDAATVEAWFSLSFGLQHIHAVRELPPAEFVVRAGSLVIRPADTRDIDAIVALEPILRTHSGQSPVFSSMPPTTPEAARADVEEELEDARFARYVAELRGALWAQFCSARWTYRTATHH